MLETISFHKIFVILHPKSKQHDTMKTRKLILLMAVIALTATSCKKDLFDKDIYNGLVDYQFMIDNTDPSHDWCLTKNDTILLLAPDINLYSVQILTANPYTSTNAEIAAEGVCYGYQAELTYTMPITQQTIYIAVLSNKGEYLGVTSVPYGTKELELSADMLSHEGTLTKPTYQTFTYLYECTFPMPDDFDYNDMVLRITKSLPNVANSLQVDLTVKLEAAGADQLYAAAIQLPDFRYDEIEKVEIVSGEKMDKGYPLDRTFLTNSSTLFRGRQGQAVIGLFECAQWAFSKNQDDLGDIPLLRYNTAPSDKEDYSTTAAPVVTTYRITFKSREIARRLSFDRIDPFLLHMSDNGGIWEVHTYAHKFDEVTRSIYNGQESAYDNRVSWALVIPDGNFRYPIEGVAICRFSSESGEIFGPYDYYVYWMQNQKVRQDWYLTPTRPQLCY